MSQPSPIALPDPFFLIVDSGGSLRAHSLPPFHPCFSLAESRVGEPPVSLCEALIDGFNPETLDSILKSPETRGWEEVPIADTGFQIQIAWSRLTDNGDMHLQFSARVDPTRWLEAPHNKAMSDQGEVLSAVALRLQQAESRLNSLTHSFPGVLFTQRTDNTFAYASSKISDFTGIAVGKLQRSTIAFAELIHPEDRMTVLDTVREKSHAGVPYSMEYRIIHQENQSVRFVYDIRLPVLTSTGAHIQDEGIWIDITRQAIAEDRIAHSLWKENLSLITSGLVHDFSNIMAGIYSLSELYYSEMEPDHPRYEGMNKVKTHAMKAQQLVRRIVDLNREVTGEVAYHNLEVLVHDHLDVIRILLPKSVAVALDFPDEELLVRVDAVGFSRALTHMVTNARDVLSQTKTFGVTVEMTDSGYLMHVWDDGPGFPATVRDHAFEPFVSTKTDQDAAGFGLYTVKQFVEASGGHVRLGSGRYSGAHIEIFLPAAGSEDGPPNFIEETGGLETNDRLTAPAPASATLPRVLVIYGGKVGQKATQELLASKNWALEIAENSEEGAQILQQTERPIGVAVWVLDLADELESIDTKPFLPFGDEILLAGLILDHDTQVPAMPPEPFDLLLPARAGSEALHQRIEPWLA